MKQHDRLPTLHESFLSDWEARRGDRRAYRVTIRQAEIVLEALARLERQDLDIVDIGCGARWFSKHLARFGWVTGIDLADLDWPRPLLERAGYAKPAASASDFMPRYFTLGIPPARPGATGFDVVLCLGTPGPDADLRTFVRQVAEFVGTGAHFLWSTANDGHDSAFTNSERWTSLLDAAFELEDFRVAQVDSLDDCAADPQAGADILVMLARKRTAI